MSVYSTVVSYLKLRSFSWKHGIDYFSVRFPFRIVITSQINEGPDLPNSDTGSYCDGVTEKARSAGRWLSLFKAVDLYFR